MAQQIKPKRNSRGQFVTKKRSVQRKPRYVAKAKRRVVKRNPTGRDYRKAVRLYSDFHGENPRHEEDWTVVVPGTALEVGKVTGILYKTRVDGRQQEFMHEFTGNSRPTLAASSDGRQLLLLGGDYKFTDRGIVDGTVSF
jgi:hypothetical protein